MKRFCHIYCGQETDIIFHLRLQCQNHPKLTYLYEYCNQLLSFKEQQFQVNSQVHSVALKNNIVAMVKVSTIQSLCTHQSINGIQFLIIAKLGNNFVYNWKILHLKLGLQKGGCSAQIITMGKGGGKCSSKESCGSSIESMTPKSKTHRGHHQSSTKAKDLDQVVDMDSGTFVPFIPKVCVVFYSQIRFMGCLIYC